MSDGKRQLWAAGITKTRIEELLEVYKKKNPIGKFTKQSVLDDIVEKAHKREVKS